MRKLLIYLSIILLVACQQTPEVSRTAKIKSYQGKWIILNYWATWNKKSLAEIPQLNNFYQAVKNKNVVILAVNYDGISKEKLKKFAEKHHINYPLLTHDPGLQIGIKYVTILPVTYVIDPEGKIIKKFYSDLTSEKLLSIIKQ